jgi:hypothetical protein
VGGADGENVWAPVGTWFAPALTTAGVAAGVAVVSWVAGHVHPDRTLHEAALFAHLASLTIGFGAVLAVDWVALLWLLQRRTLADVLGAAGNAHAPAWIGYAGLTLSGMLLQPDLTNPLTQLKLALVVVIGWNGVVAALTQRWLARIASGGVLSQRRLLACACSGVVSQLGWWGAMLLGFVNGR